MTKDTSCYQFSLLLNKNKWPMIFFLFACPVWIAADNLYRSNATTHHLMLMRQTFESQGWLQFCSMTTKGIIGSVIDILVYYYETLKDLMCHDTLKAFGNRWIIDLKAIQFQWKNFSINGDLGSYVWLPCFLILALL